MFIACRFICVRCFFPILSTQRAIKNHHHYLNKVEQVVASTAREEEDENEEEDVNGAVCVRVCLFNGP